MSEHESPNKLSSQTTPTWEVELLISGVAVFAMLQLPGWLDDGVFAVMPRLNEAWATLLKLLYVYAKSAAVILASTFVIHLLLRARWIALVGMHSVYPDGVRWDKLRLGPLQREIETDYEVPTAVVIERADNLATTVFAIGVMLTLALVLATVGVALVMGTSTVIAAALGWKNGGVLLFALLFAMFLLPYALAVNLDRRFGARWTPAGRIRKMVDTMLRLYARIGMRSGNNRVKALLASHGGDRRVGVLIFLIISITVGTVMLTYESTRKGRPVGNYGLFPVDVSPAMQSAHYDDQRNPSRDAAVPFVQSMAIADAYLKLLVPYDPRNDESVLQQNCAAAETGRAVDLLPCLQALHSVKLDGKPVANLHYEIASDPRTDRPALLAMIDIRSLAQGRHELRVGRAPSPTSPSGEKSDEAAPDAEDYIIPFWR